MRFFKGLFLVLSVGCFFKAQASEERSPERPQGWLWYKESHLKKTPQESSPAASPKTPLTAVERLAILQKHFEEVKARAVLEPTLEHVEAVRRVHAQIVQLSSTFSDRWMEAELLDPLGEALPTSPGAVTIARQEQEKESEGALRVLARTHVLLLVFSQTCPYCEAFAPLVLQFAQTYGFTVEGLSAHPGCFKGFTCTQNAAAVQALSPHGHVPVLFLVNPQTHQTYPLARGYVNWADLHQNAFYLLNALKGQNP